MVSIPGANSAAPLIAQYNTLQAAILSAQQAIASGEVIQQITCKISGGSCACSVAIAAADSAAVFGALIQIWTKQLAKLESQLAGLT